MQPLQFEAHKEQIAQRISNLTQNITEHSPESPDFSWPNFEPGTTPDGLHRSLQKTMLWFCSLIWARDIFWICDTCWMFVLLWLVLRWAGSQCSPYRHGGGGEHFMHVEISFLFPLITVEPAKRISKAKVLAVGSCCDFSDFNRALLVCSDWRCGPCQRDFS